MFKKAVSYENLFAEEGDPPTKTEVLHFHLYQAQLVELELQAQVENNDEDKGLEWELNQVQLGKEKGGYNGAQIMAFFKRFLKASYGIREGDQFVQTDEISQRFIRSSAFDAFLRLISTNEKIASEFVNGIMPRELLELAGRTIKDNKVSTAALPEYPNQPTEEELRLSGLEHPLDEKGNLLPWWDREPTHAEQQDMPKAQLMEVFRRKSSDWTPRGA